jgi:hypothetical protein
LLFGNVVFGKIHLRPLMLYQMQFFLIVLFKSIGWRRLRVWKITQKSSAYIIMYTFTCGIV